MVTSSTTSYGGANGHELQQKCPKINEANGDKIFSKLLSKENSSSIMTANNNNNNMNSSFRVYYGGSAGAAIPFMWESTPGTPKHTFPNSSLPPLTPPPSSYHGFHSNSTKSSSSSSLSSSSSPSMKKHSKHNNLLYTIFPRLNSRKKSNVSPLSSTVSSPSFSMSSSPSYSSSSSSSNSTIPNTRGKSFVSRPKSPIYFGFDHHDDQEEEHDKAFGSSSSPTSTLCFGAKRRTNSDGLRACFRWRM